MVATAGVAISSPMAKSGSIEDRENEISVGAVLVRSISTRNTESECNVPAGVSEPLLRTDTLTAVVSSSIMSTNSEVVPSDNCPATAAAFGPLTLKPVMLTKTFSLPSIKRSSRTVTSNVPTVSPPSITNDPVDGVKSLFAIAEPPLLLTV